MQQHIQNHQKYLHLVPRKLEVLQGPCLSEKERQRALSYIMRDSYFSQTVATLTTGVFLVGFALQFNASNFLIGLLAAVPFLVQLLQLPAIYLIHRFKSRKKVTFAATLASRLLLLPLALTPLIPSQKLALTVLIGGFIVHAAVAAMAACAWNSWVKDVVPTHELGSFFSRKLGLATAITILLTLIGGLLIDVGGQHFIEHKAFVYGGIFLVAMVIGLIGVPMLRRIPEPPPKVEKDHSLLKSLLEPLKDRNFRALIGFMTTWNFAINLAAPFFTVYMLTLLDFPMILVTTMTVASQLANLAFLRIWGRLADRFSNKSVLMISAPLFILCILGWTFTTLPDQHALTLPLVLVLHILLGIATAGVTLANGNIAMKLAPEGRATAYLATNSMLASLAAGIAPILGGLFADVFARQELSLVLHWQAPGSWFALKTLDFHSWDFFFGLAFLVGLVSLGRLEKIQEVGDIKEKAVVLRAFMLETRRSFHNMSSVYGMRTLTGVSFSMFRNSLRTVGRLAERLIVF